MLFFGQNLSLLNFPTVAKNLARFVASLGMVLAGSLLAKLRPSVFDKLFLWQGRLDKLK